MTTAEQGQKPWVEALHEVIGDAVSSEPQGLQANSNDEGYRYEAAPRPESTALARVRGSIRSSSTGRRL